MTEQQRNEQAAEKLCQDFAWEGESFQEGVFVALLDGKIVATGNDPADVIAALRTMEPDTRRGMVVEVAHPVVDVIR